MTDWKQLARDAQGARDEIGNEFVQYRRDVTERLERVRMNVALIAARVSPASSILPRAVDIEALAEAALADLDAAEDKVKRLEAENAALRELLARRDNSVEWDQEVQEALK